jgi:hypothetical protein
VGLGRANGLSPQLQGPLPLLGLSLLGQGAGWPVTAQLHPRAKMREGFGRLPPGAIPLHRHRRLQRRTHGNGGRESPRLHRGPPNGAPILREVPPPPTPLRLRRAGGSTSPSSSGTDTSLTTGGETRNTAAWRKRRPPGRPEGGPSSSAARKKRPREGEGDDLPVHVPGDGGWSLLASLTARRHSPEMDGSRGAPAKRAPQGRRGRLRPWVAGAPFLTHSLSSAQHTNPFCCN